MIRARVLSLLALVALLGACAPFQASAPVGRAPEFCEWVRNRVRDNTMPLELAERYYPECRPFQDGGA